MFLSFAAIKNSIGKKMCSGLLKLDTDDFKFPHLVFELQFS